jgi:hypothetical protein
MTKFDDLTAFLPTPAELHQEAIDLCVEEDADYFSFKQDILPNFDAFISVDGAGQEGKIAFLKQDGKVVGALMYAYDHESDLADLAEDWQNELSHTLFINAPEEFKPVLEQGSPFTWKYPDYPSTFTSVFATAAVWNVGEGWVVANDDVTADEAFKHIKYSFKKLPFVKEYKQSVVQ